MEGAWIKEGDGDAVVVFVHGFLSSGEKCWRNDSGVYWPELVANDEALAHYGVYVFTYKTTFFSGRYNLGDVVDSLKENMDLDEVLQRKVIKFVCHSMGGIVVRKFLVERAIHMAEDDHEFGLFLLASPSLGADYANWLEPIARLLGHAQADALRFAQDNTWLMSLDKEFQNLKSSELVKMTGKELVEDVFIFASALIKKPVVEVYSGFRYFGEPYKVPDSDHFSIAKPASARSIQHRMLRRFLVGQPSTKGRKGSEADPRLAHRQNGRTDEPRETLSPALNPPSFQHAVSRAGSIDVGIESCKSFPVICVGGLAGNGKTHFVSDLTETLVARKDVDRTIWFDPSRGDTVEALLAACSNVFETSGTSVAGQCRQLIDHFVRSNLTLVIDDFHNVDQETFLPLVRAAALQKPPVRLIIVSRMLPDELAAEFSVKLLPVNPFGEQETAELLAKRNICLDDEVVKTLCSKTGGLPLALTIFCSLVERGHSPSELLEGELASIERLRRWFLEISNLVKSEATRLLQVLSLVDGAFDSTIVRLLSREILGSQAIDQFHVLNRSFLAEKYGTGRWRVHDLVGNMCRGSIDPKVKGAVHRILANHFNQISGGWKRKPTDDTDLQNKIKACKHFTESGYTKEQAIRAASMIVPELKRRGYYQQLVALIGPLRRKEGGNDWIDYHFAHCLLIMGRVNDALDVAQQLAHSDLSQDANLRMASFRLYAESVQATGDGVAAERILSGALSRDLMTTVNAVTSRHARTTLAGIEISNGRQAAGITRIVECLDEAERSSDKRGVAICNTWLGIAKLSEPAEAIPFFQIASQLFDETSDTRGLAWSLTNIAEATAKAGDDKHAIDALKRASEISEELELENPEFPKVIDRLFALVNPNTDLHNALLAEREKWSKLVSLARRLIPPSR